MHRYRGLRKYLHVIRIDNNSLIIDIKKPPENSGGLKKYPKAF